MSELPLMASTSYMSTTSTAAELMDPKLFQAAVARRTEVEHRFNPNPPAFGAHIPQPTIDLSKLAKDIQMAAAPRRLVQVFIADTDENVPLDDCLIYSGEQKLTDLTDQELFFEIDIRTLLQAHNDKRTKLVNKAVKERTEYLEPARIRDLKMTVVVIATF